MPATDKAIQQFTSDSGIGDVSPVFLNYCQTDNGGITDLDTRYFMPRTEHGEYWDYIETLVIRRSGILSISKLLGINSGGKWDILEDAQAAWIWRLSKEFYPVASDAFGNRMVSRLTATDDRVYYWEHTEIQYLLIADSLLEFYEGLGPDPFEV